MLIVHTLTLRPTHDIQIVPQVPRILHLAKICAEIITQDFFKLRSSNCIMCQVTKKWNYYFLWLLSCDLRKQLNV